MHIQIIVKNKSKYEYAKFFYVKKKKKKKYKKTEKKISTAKNRD
jgi:hypothetical protein